MNNRSTCDCLGNQCGRHLPQNLQLHADVQDTECQAWNDLLEFIEAAARDGREKFAPGQELGRDAWMQIVTLPSTIAKLKNVIVFSRFSGPRLSPG
ncbi:MAG: hypothetical protein ABII06_21550 [Pseudomonadota bacterium]